MTASFIQIRAEIMERGWSPSLQSFRQHYDADTLDASTLLIPLMGFLGPVHPCVVATVQRIEQDLTIDGMVYRFRPEGWVAPITCSWASSKAPSCLAAFGWPRSTQ
jgi:GH15 family glucan-1,4-alpha-glucosidase